MDTKRYAAFVAAADARSLSGAAKQLGYTTPGIVRLVNALEAELGFAVLLRSSNGVSVTPEGERLLPFARDLLRSEERARQAGAQIRGKSEGVLRIGMQTGIAPEWFADALARFASESPGVETSLQEASVDKLSEMLAVHEVDCCLAGAEIQGADQVLLTKREVDALVSAESPLCANASVLLAELAEGPVACPASLLDCLGGLLRERPKLSGAIAYVVEDVSTALPFVRSGLCNALVLDGGYATAGSGLVALPLSPRRYVDVRFCLPGSAVHAPAAEALLDFMANFAGAQPVARRGE